ncbi:hypothetical protein Tco_0246515 [Tanacetum coccineum]
MMLIFGLLEALEMEALVDAMDVDNVLRDRGKGREESKEEEGYKKENLKDKEKINIVRKRRFRQDTSEDENDELRLCLTIALDEDKEYDETKDLEEIYLKVVIKSNGQRRYFSTLMSMLSIFDKDDLCAVYQLVMDKYQDKIPEDFDKGVHTLMTEAGLVIHMLVEKKYHLRKKVLLQMIKLVPGKDKIKSVDSQIGLLKKLDGYQCTMLWFSIHLVVYNEELAIPEQTATGKGTSNPLMAGSLPKTTKPT